MLRGLRITGEYRSDYASEYFNIFFLLTFEKILVQSPLGDRKCFHHCHTCVFQGRVFQSCPVSVLLRGKDESETFASFLSGLPFSGFVHDPYVSRIPRLAGCRQGTCPIRTSHLSCSGVSGIVLNCCQLQKRFVYFYTRRRLYISWTVLTSKEHSFSLLLLSAWHLY